MPSKCHNTVPVVEHRGRRNTDLSAETSELSEVLPFIGLSVVSRGVMLTILSHDFISLSSVTGFNSDTSKTNSYLENAVTRLYSDNTNSVSSFDCDKSVTRFYSDNTNSVTSFDCDKSVTSVPSGDSITRFHCDCVCHKIS